MAEQLPMTDDEKDWLMSIFVQRKKDLLFAGSFRCLLHVVFSFFVTLWFVSLIHDMLFSGNDIWLSGAVFFSWIGLKFLFIFLITIGICILSYVYWMLPLKKDAVAGMKQKKNYTVTRKECYPVTGQYFIRINNKLDRKYEVTEDVYNNCEEGGVITMEEGINSGYILCDNDFAKVKLFEIRRPSQFDYDV